ncbi:signal peptide peptidase SppA [Elizabethkingia meningoseptica]|uniref:signal peptide peptidase SppA n=1 Tax=Elizabethkingia meningoseptica TaxID=238 RepID=UPI000332C9BD|nr:signal peptide peptidase SppA [Elizabethkingia meningoseptica]AQX03958.1 signal peptide peptidase SppA [Elizabethkingia meningoseptica]AQX45998.1 signal peptide peptidase SppA [Elizabethkingia meningoseptica]EJK5329240.1 signal peptide peptidase SppA [Elizabethkingia meningoseptica]EOR30344.1 protease IV [Elizabethkingia meningoseptica ATCC 13253 = NBRC 12535]KUY15290.1 signal peptide peptidase SppA [Elizabethkingia meningoseptica]
MKNFIKSVMANIVAILLVGFIFIIGFVFFILISSMSGKGSVNVKDNSILVLNLKDNIIESTTELSPSIFDLGKDSSVKISDILNAINQAKNDKKITGISIETDATSAGITQIDDIRKALEDFKKSGKFVYAYGNNVSQSSYYLSTVADQYYLNPAGGVELKGLSTEVVFFKDLFDKYGIGADVIRHGKYKSAVEPYLTNKISDENKEQLSFLLNDIWGNISKKIETSRKLNSEELKTTVDSLYGIIPEYALKSKLIDKLVQKSEYDDILKGKLKVAAKDDLNRVSIGNYITYLDKNSSSSTAKNQVAVLYASGEIFGGKGNAGIYSESLIDEIKKIGKNDDIKAVVLRINSPGGSANASDEILFELQQLKTKKPLVVSFGDYAASGGYYIAMAGQKIFSEANTLTGSIGVFGLVMNFKDLANKNGLRSDVVETNANSKMFSALSGMTPGTRNMMQKSVEQTYKRFVYFVTQNRKKTFEEIDSVGGGHVWSGIRAKELGLVDEIGTLDDAVKYAAGLAKTKDYNIRSYPKDKSNFEKFFESMNEDDVAAKAIETKFGKENYQLFQKINNPNNKGVQMALPYYIKIQ